MLISCSFTAGTFNVIARAGIVFSVAGALIQVHSCASIDAWSVDIDSGTEGFVKGKDGGRTTHIHFRASFAAAWSIEDDE